MTSVRIACVVETRLIASVQLIASVAKIVGYHHHGMVLKNISFLFAFSQNEHTFMTAHFGSNCANERETTLAPTAEKSGDIFNKRVLPTLFFVLCRDCRKITINFQHIRDTHTTRTNKDFAYHSEKHYDCKPK